MMIKRMVGGAALVMSLAASAKGTSGPGTEPGAVRSSREASRGAARAAYVAGKRAQDGAERRRHFAEGVERARALLAANPNDPEGLLWLAANLGSEALERGKLFALRVLPEMERLLLRLDSVAPDYDHAAAARTLGRLYHQAPALISIGSNAKARQWFERALARAGDFPANQALAADLFADEGLSERAHALALAALAFPMPRDPEPDVSEWRAIAQKVAARTAR